MRKLGKQNQINDESVEAFYCFCVVCSCSCYCQYYYAKYKSETGGLKSSTDSSRRSSSYR